MKAIKTMPSFRILYAFIFIFLASLGYSCNSDSNKSGRELIAGTSSKTWRATKEENAAGDTERLSKDERNDVMQFYANGNFTINTLNEASNGTWTYNDNNKTLSLQFADANVTENFQVLELKENQMRVRGGDGGEMTLKAD